MAGGRKYSAKQIRFAMQCIMAGFARKEVIEMYKMRFGVTDWGIAQFKYLRSIYGDHPDFGCTLVNRTEMTEAQKAALRSRLAAEASLGPSQVDTDKVADLMSPKVRGQRNVPHQQSYNSTPNAQSAQQQQGNNSTSNAQSALQQQGYNSTSNSQSFVPVAQQPNGDAFSNP
ncbi:hypothetical protein KJ359_009226 [Pestalotiopsis sp. 9143b]|nr:hypothetical protein KJ359_009226 [Pestalotiopsis sp. 9143b]